VQIPPQTQRVGIRGKKNNERKGTVSQGVTGKVLIPSTPPSNVGG